MTQNSSYTPKIMGIINVTPDSFSDGGEFLEVEKAVKHGLKLEKDGATILDIGGESTRPNSAKVSIEEELERVIPVIEGLRLKTDITISIDTRNAVVMKKALEAGATMINDVSALTNDDDSLDLVAESKVPVCLMHMQGTPDTMQENPTYEDVVSEVFNYLEERVSICVEEGIEKDKIIIDVGIGFGKTLEHNLELLKNLEKFKTLGTKVMLGASRKAFIQKICGESATKDKRLAGSLGAVSRGLDAKVDIFRVHDVFETKQFIDVYQSLK